MDSDRDIIKHKERLGKVYSKFENNIMSIKGVGEVNFDFLNKKQKYHYVDWKKVLLSCFKHFKNLNIDFTKVSKVH